MNYLNEIEDEIKGLGFEIIEKDFERPWGGFLVISEKQAQEFANKFFDGLNIDSLKISGKLSPKILIINPNSKLLISIDLKILIFFIVKIYKIF